MRKDIVQTAREICKRTGYEMVHKELLSILLDVRMGYF